MVDNIQQQNILNQEQIDLLNNAQEAIENLVKADSFVENYDQLLENAVVSLAQALASCDTFDYRNTDAFAQFGEIIKNIAENHGLAVGLKPIVLNDHEGNTFQLPIISISNQEKFNQDFVNENEVSAYIVLVGHSDKVRANDPEFYKLKIKTEVRGERILQGRGANDMLVQVASGLISMILAKDSNLTYAMVLVPDEELGCRWSKNHLPKIEAELVIDIEPTGNVSGVLSFGMPNNLILDLEIPYFKDDSDRDRFILNLKTKIEEYIRTTSLNSSVRLAAIDGSIFISIFPFKQDDYGFLGDEIFEIFQVEFDENFKGISKFPHNKPIPLVSKIEALCNKPENNNQIYIKLIELIKLYFQDIKIFPEQPTHATIGYDVEPENREVKLNSSFSSTTTMISKFRNAVIFSIAEFFPRHSLTEAALISDIVKFSKILTDLLRYKPEEL